MPRGRKIKLNEQGGINGGDATAVEFAGGRGRTFFPGVSQALVSFVTSQRTDFFSFYFLFF